MGSQNRSFRRWTKLKSADKKNEILKRFELFEIPDKSYISISFSIFLTGGPQTKRLWCETSNFFDREQSKMILSYKNMRRGFHYPPPKQNSVCNMKIVFHFIWCSLFGYSCNEKHTLWLYGYSIAFTWLNKENPKYNFNNFLVMYPACFGINSFWWK